MCRHDENLDRAECHRCRDEAALRALAVLGADARYRALCAWTADPGRRAAAARRFNAVAFPWLGAGAPAARLLRLAARAVHLALAPLRALRGTAGR